LAEAGASVIVTSRRRDRAEALVGTLPRVGTAIHRALELDHLRSESLAEQFLHAVDQTGGIDILVNNGHEAAAADWTTITAQQFSRQLENATGYFLLARLLRDHAVQRGGSGNVIFLGSMYALVGSYRAQGKHRADDSASGGLLGQGSGACQLP
jgi:NAD(P)-dependent dehydrogenase (short-subunit alcohol dehydrogenase family)